MHYLAAFKTQGIVQDCDSTFAELPVKTTMGVSVWREAKTRRFCTTCAKPSSIDNVKEWPCA